ncbi:ribonuclease [Undibacterium jejuense]|uniref:Ribonuclease n=2 Tax=Undibacterium jejuense TaxID=1344949 RepID=A0A923HHC8_9BURK|nr:ribonuclease [Undibacterium jejuense]MBC3863005.1 ribonuclease [Undibacterium jejuense]
MMLNVRYLSRFLLLLLFSLLASLSVAKDNSAYIAVAELPREAQATLSLIKQGGPFPYAKDGVTFGNYESRLPRQRRGYYHEYTVPTPGARNRGIRRIIAGADPVSSGEYYYTDDHYQTFRRIKE